MQIGIHPIAHSPEGIVVMRNQLAAVELRVLVNEFGQLAGSRLGQVYDLQAASGGGKAIVLQLSVA